MAWEVLYDPARPKLVEWRWMREMLMPVPVGNGRTRSATSFVHCPPVSTSMSFPELFQRCHLLGSRCLDASTSRYSGGVVSPRYAHPSVSKRSTDSMNWKPVTVLTPRPSWRIAAMRPSLAGVAVIGGASGTVDFG